MSDCNMIHIVNRNQVISEVVFIKKEESLVDT